MITERDTEDLKKFGENLKKIRERLGLSLRKLAQNCDIDHSDIAKMERGEINITLLTGLQLARALQVPLPELLSFQYES